MKYHKKDNSIESAKRAIALIKKTTLNKKIKSTNHLISELSVLNQKLLASKPDPLLKNTLSYILYKARRMTLEKTKKVILSRTESASDKLANSGKKLAEFGQEKIKRGTVVFAHGYSDEVIEILIKAKKAGINFEVYNTELKPFLDGRLMAQKLAKEKIFVKQHADLALRIALKKSDLILIGAEAISTNGQVYSKIGSELIAEIAEKYDIPVYVCTDSWRYCPVTVQRIEKNKTLQPQKQIWTKPPKGVVVMNYGFEKINPKLITGIITEKGIFKPHHLISEAKKDHLWINQK